MNHLKAVLYGVAIWAITFIAAMAAFPLRANDRPLFESIMPVVLTIAAAFFSCPSPLQESRNMI